MTSETGVPDILFAVHGTAARARAGQPLQLEGSGHVWKVEAGAVDLFLSRLEDGQPAGALFPLGRRVAGQLLWGLPVRRRCQDWCLVALGNGDSRLVAVPGSVLVLPEGSVLDGAWLAAALADWCDFLRAPLPGGLPEGLPLPEAGGSAHADAGSTYLGRADTVWVKLLAGAWDFLGAPEMPLTTGLVPLSRTGWLVCREAGQLCTAKTEALTPTALLAGVDALQDGLWSALVRQQQVQAQEEVLRLHQKAHRETDKLGQALGHLAAVLARGDRWAVGEDGGKDALWAACCRLGRVAGIEFRPPPPGQADAARDVLAEIAEASRVRRRRVTLAGSWWQEDGLPLLSFRKQDGQPVVLAFFAGAYHLLPSSGGASVRVDAALAAELEDFAWAFYRGLGETCRGLVEMLRFGSLGCWRDYLMVIAMGIAIGLIGMVTPMATGMLFDSVIPGADKNQLLQLTLALLAAAFATSLFDAARGFAVLRVEGRLDLAVQSAIWDRLMRLPSTFFRDYSAGDLAMRANGVHSILQLISGTTLQTLMGAVFSSFNLALLFYYNVKLGLLALGLVGVAVFVTVLAGFLRLRHERHLASMEGRISGQVLQLLSGIAKLRAAGAETRAFFNWAMNYGQQQEHTFRARMVGNVLDVFNSIFPTLANLLIFGLVAFYLTDDKSFSTGHFMAFNAAFGGFLGAMLAATGAVMAILNVVPIYERARPILQTPMEITEAKAHPGVLSGDIEISHLSFSYTADGPVILKDINLHIRAGEFVAIVGASGSGKSTLLRLLLGFEQPTLGALYYDSQDMSGLDLGALRRQLGVVLQNGQLISGDIFGNIVGSAPLTLDDAWAAAEQAGLAADIREMPMGMHTMVSDGGSTLSGGQRQRLMIARAIVHRPRILFFDEATSALDNQTQAVVSDSMAQLRATRVVIAHRLSTIVHADRILVMDGGQIVQSGTYAELLATDGLFADLARRQII
ncbi:MAG TPA: NHLP bacteriocin export ABC transporter permease/ATPase subunit [Burkholderiaceae bacterium]|nr:NHLP bacteriocin export ABC transporter permease/ATPase subunit [Burkholderiaceae bacterium]